MYRIYLKSEDKLIQDQLLKVDQRMKTEGMHIDQAEGEEDDNSRMTRAKKRDVDSKSSKREGGEGENSRGKKRKIIDEKTSQKKKKKVLMTTYIIIAKIIKNDTKPCTHTI